jgi:hypothetical protein
VTLIRQSLASHTKTYSNILYFITITLVIPKTRCFTAILYILSTGILTA